MALPTAAVVHEVAGSLSSKVELFLSCRNLKNMDLLSKSDPFVVVYTRINARSPWVVLTTTKTIDDNLNPDWAGGIQMEYHFEQIQEMKFDVYDRDSDSTNLQDHDFIGGVTTTLSRIVGSAGSTFSQDLKKPGSTDYRGRMIVRADEVSACLDEIHLTLSCTNLDRKDWFGFGRSDPFVYIFRAMNSNPNSQANNTWAKVFESEVIKRELNPKWKPIHISRQALDNGDGRPIKVQVLDWNSNGSHELIGEFITSVDAFTQAGKVFTLKHPDLERKKGSKYKGSGELKIDQARVEKRFSFLEYIKGGLDLNLITAIDFTASNGAPSTRESLHTRHQENDYIKAIKSVGAILQDYDSDGKIPLFGFGGAINGSVSHCFPLNFDPNTPEVEGIAGILDAYNNAFSCVSLSGPTLFEEIIAKANQYAAADDCSQTNQAYTILLILTDGVINDMNKTIDQIVQGSTLPLSIIIVGVGSAVFDNMEVLDADDVPLRSSSGREMKRDIVQFVPFRQFANSHLLAQEVLREVPGQVVDYMSQNHIKPRPPTIASARHLAIEQSTRGLVGAPSSRNVASGVAAAAVPVAVAVSATAPPAPHPSSHSF